MKPYQRDFIDFALRCNVLTFGEFELKSGRKSPYFFNSGKWHDGEAYTHLSHFYAQAISDYFLDEYDVLFGPAYKGISLATAASIGLNLEQNQNVPVAFNRKEIKNHAEGGQLIGAELKGRRVLLVDDVITAGTTINESINIINNAQGKLIGAIIALDRQEKATNSTLSAIQEIAEKEKLRIESIINLTNIVNHLADYPLPNSEIYLQQIADYRLQYGIF